MRLTVLASLLALAATSAFAQGEVNVYNWSDYIAEAELKAAWEAVPYVTRRSVLPPPVDASDYQQVTEGPATLPRTYRPIKPLKDTEQLSLFG